MNLEGALYVHAGRPRTREREPDEEDARAAEGLPGAGLVPARAEEEVRQRRAQGAGEFRSLVKIQHESSRCRVD